VGLAGLDGLGQALNYYKRHIGDYAKKAGRLSILQHGVYTQLIDACYDREAFPTRDEAIDWVWASSTAEVEALDFVLRKFFTLNDGHFVEKSIEADLAAYRAKSEMNTRIAHERETARKAGRTHRARTVHEPSEDRNESPPNHKPITTNQEPQTNTQRAPVAPERCGPHGPARAGSVPSASDAAADAMTAAGLTDVSKGHPTLRKLIEADVSVMELADAAAEAVKRGNGFAWALARVEGQRRDAASKPPIPRGKGSSSDPDTRAAIESDGERLGLGRWQQLDSRGNTVTWQSYADRVRAARAAESEEVNQ
jgi:uncharacterized protein YdaU (DUF1376 family)